MNAHNIYKPHYDTGIIRAVKEGRWSDVHDFLKRGADREGVTWAVNEAAKKAPHDELRVLIVPNSPDSCLDSVLVHATRRGLWSVVHSVLQRSRVSDEERKETVSQALKNGSETALEAVQSFCKGEEVDAFLGVASKKGHWRLTLELFQRGLNQKQRLKVASAAIQRNAFDNLPEMLHYCEEEDTEALLKTAVEKRTWEAVSLLLQRRVTDGQRDWAVTQACKHASVEHVKDIIGYCSPDIADSVQLTLKRRGLWMMLLRLPAFFISKETRSLAVKEVCKTASEQDLIDYALPRCPEVCVDSVLFTVGRRGFWRAVTVLLQRGDVSEESRGQVVEAACRTAKEEDVLRVVPFCPAANLSPALTSLAKRKDVGPEAMEVLLRRDVDDRYRGEFIVKYSKHGPYGHLFTLLPLCPDTHIEAALEIVAERRNMLVPTAMLLERDVSEVCRGRAVVAACKVTPTDTHKDNLLVAEILPLCPQSHLDDAIAVLTKKCLWKSVLYLLRKPVSNTQRVHAVKEALKIYRVMSDPMNAPQCNGNVATHIRSLLFHVGRDHLDLVMSTFIHQGRDQDVREILYLSDSEDLKHFARESHLYTRAAPDRTTLLHIVCITGLWRTLAKVVERGANPLALNFDGFSLLSLAARNASCPEELVAECLKLGVSTYQPRQLSGRFCWFADYLWISSITTRACSPSWWAAMEKKDLTLMRILYESGACCNKELHKLSSLILRKPRGQSTEEDDPLQTFSSYIQKIASVPRRLKSACRLVISHSLGVGVGREQKADALPLPESLRQYVLFADLMEGETVFNVVDSHSPGYRLNSDLKRYDLFRT